ncbi:urease subunit alpha [Streptomyces sp. NPDC048253]|uniref:urease subunit alpha n=1 Tax=unclassified Streptomyces TaxID=2593676 RepID=UPI00341E8D32
MKISRDRYAQLYGPTTGDAIRLADTDLWVTVASDDALYGDELLGGCGKTLRDGLLVSPNSGGDSALDMVIAGVVVLDPVLGVRKTNIGIKDGRIVSVGRAGNPDHDPDVTGLVDSHTAIVPGEGLIATAGAVDSHVHLSSPELVPAALSAGVTTLVGMGLGGVWDVGCNPAYNLHTLFESWRGLPMNVAFLARGSTVAATLHEQAIASGAGGFKVHEDFGATPAIIDACLNAAAQADLPVAIHTDSLNESGSLQDTLDATRGRTVHAYHVEGGGGHPNLLEILSAPHVLPSSTTPTIPFTAATVTELMPMTMTVHRQHHAIPSDLAVSASRIRERAIAAENALHDLGAIGIVNSDSMGMGRIAETVRRTWQLAHLSAHHAGQAGPSVDNTERVLRFLAKITLNPAIAHGMAHEVGSLQTGRMADIVLWNPAWFGTKPELVLKGGFAVWGNVGSASGSTRLGEPRAYRPYFGAMGDAPRRLSGIFVSGQTLDDTRLRRALPQGLNYLRVAGSRELTRNDLSRNTATPTVVVPTDSSPVTVNGTEVSFPPADDVPLGQLHHFA